MSPRTPADGRSGRPRLVLVRHATAEPGTDGSDRLRALTLDGRGQASAVGRWLAEHDLVPQHVLVSSALRTRQTWELAATACTGASAADVAVHDELYEASAGDLLELLRRVPAATSTVLVVGHEPTVSLAADALATADSDGTARARVRAGLPTAGAAVLEPVVPWPDMTRGGARLLRAGGLPG